jgi:hypothetical protein
MRLRLHETGPRCNAPPLTADQQAESARILIRQIRGEVTHEEALRLLEECHRIREDRS